MGRKKRNYVISSWKGIDYIKFNAAKVKHSAATIRTYSIFGEASKCSKIVRELFNDVLPQPKSITIRHRLQNAFSSWLRTDPLNNTVDAIPFFNGLSLHPKNEWQQFFKLPVLVIRNGNGQLQAQLPAFDPAQQIKAPAGTTGFQIRIAVAAMQINDCSGQAFFKTDWLLDYKPGLVNATNINLPIDTTSGRLILVAISLQYFTSNNLEVNQLTWKPAGIVGSFYN